MEIIIFFALAIIALSFTSKDSEEHYEHRPPRRRRRRPIIIDEDEYDDEDYYERWRANHRAAIHYRALQHTILFVGALIVGMFLFKTGCHAPVQDKIKTAEYVKKIPY